MAKVLLFGMIIFDRIEGKEYIGGPALNVALHMACKGCQPVLVSAVGQDKLGDSAKNLLAKSCVSVEYIQTDLNHETGKVNVILDHNGIPTFDIKKDVAYDYITLTQQQIDALSQNAFDLLYFGTVSQRSKTSADTLHTILKEGSFKYRFYDINLRKGHYKKEVIDFSLFHTDIFKLNEKEIMELSHIFDIGKDSEEDIANWIFCRYPVQIIIITRGDKGVSIYTPQFREYINGIKVKVKDTVGAGDAFSAAFIMDYIENKNVVQAAIKGNELGAYVAARSGAVPEIYEL